MTCYSSYLYGDKKEGKEGGKDGGKQTKTGIPYLRWTGEAKFFVCASCTYTLQFATARVDTEFEKRVHLYLTKVCGRAESATPWMSCEYT